MKVSKQQLRRQAMQDDRVALRLEKKLAGKVRKALIEQAEHFLNFGELGDAMRVTLLDSHDTQAYFWLEREYSRLKKNSDEGKGSKGSEDNEKKNAGPHYITKGGIWQRVRRNVPEFFMTEWTLWTEEIKQTRLAENIRTIDNTTMGILQNLMKETIGAARHEIAKEVMKVMKGRASKARAMTIARTESAFLANVAKEKGGESFAQETGDELGKMWIHRGAKNPRDWHVAMDTGEVIPKDVDFVVVSDEGTELMSRPHAPGATPHNTINCGCQVIYVPLDFEM